MKKLLLTLSVLLFSAATFAQEVPVAATEKPRRSEPAPEPELRQDSVPWSKSVPDRVERVVFYLDSPAEPSGYTVRTNLLYDAFLLPTLGVEWRVNRNVGVKLDGSLAWWGNEKGKVQKMWLVNPEVRWYLDEVENLYVGAGGNYGEYNTYGYLLGKLWPDNTGYQGKLWGAGLTVGYQLNLPYGFSLDFNLGLGYTNFKSDSFSMVDEVRVYKEMNKSRNFWGPTQAGVNLIWTIGGDQ